MTQTFALACGASDADNLVDAMVPSEAATLLSVRALQKTAGGTTGTFSIQVKVGESSPVALGPASAATFIDADAVAGTVHGELEVNAQPGAAAVGKHINISTVKTGTVSSNATIIFQLLWSL
jgi:hypothetical protein